MPKKSKGPRVFITLECLDCRKNINPKRTLGISRYLTTKNRRKTVEKLELLKFCKYCNKRTIHKEIK
jgi:large subunit ribosomal protein L33